MNTKLIARMFRKMADDITPMYGTGYEVVYSQKVCYSAIASVFEADLLASGEVNCLGCLHGRPMVERLKAETDAQREFAEKWWREHEGKHYQTAYYPGDLCPNYVPKQEGEVTRQGSVWARCKQCGLALTSWNSVDFFNPAVHKCAKDMKQPGPFDKQPLDTAPAPEGG